MVYDEATIFKIWMRTHYINFLTPMLFGNVNYGDDVAIEEQGWLISERNELLR